MSSVGRRTPPCRGCRHSPTSPRSVTPRSPTSSSCIRGLDEVGQQGVRRMAHRSRSHGAARPRRRCRVGSDGTARPVARRHRGRLPRREDPVVPHLLRRRLADRADRRRLTSRSRWSSTSRTIRIRARSNSSKRRSVVRRPPPWDSVTNSTWRSSYATASTVVAGISGWTWGDCCELQSLWVEPSLRGRGLATRLLAAAEAEAAARGCSQTVHFTYDFQARALYERNGYELVGSSRGLPVRDRRPLVPQSA